MTRYTRLYEKMKKYILLATALILVLLMAGCNLNQVISEAASQTQSYEQISSSESNESSATSKKEPVSSAAPTPTIEPKETPAPESSHGDGLLPSVSTDNSGFNEKFAQNSLDSAYEEDIEVSASVVDMVNITMDYSQKWNDEIDNAYMQLVEVADDVEAVKADQAEWLDNKEAEIAKISGASNAGGSMARLNTASAIMTYYRSRAAELYEKLYNYDPNFTFAFQAMG